LPKDTQAKQPHPAGSQKQECTHIQNSKKLKDILIQRLQLENQYSTLNSENLGHNISALKINNNHKIT
jgi:hypothetical protein